MVTDEQIRSAAFELYTKGKKVTIRGVTAMTGGDWHRVGKIIAELNLPSPTKPSAPVVPDNLGRAIMKATDDAYARGKADAMNAVAEVQRENELLRAKVEALTQAMAEMEKASRAASPRQVRSIVHDALSDFLGEVRPRKKRTEPQKPREYREGSYASVLIDGMSGSQIYSTRLENLTPAQTQWKREQMRFYSAKKRKKLPTPLLDAILTMPSADNSH